MKKAFTLIEMLIVVVIIGMLAAMVTAYLRHNQRQARDGRRKNDLEIIQKAIGLFYIDQSRYPNSNEMGTAMKPNQQDTRLAFRNVKDRWLIDLLNTKAQAASAVVGFFSRANSYETGNQWLKQLVIGGYIDQAPHDPAEGKHLSFVRADGTRYKDDQSIAMYNYTSLAAAPNSAYKLITRLEESARDVGSDGGTLVSPCQDSYPNSLSNMVYEIGEGSFSDPSSSISLPWSDICP